MFMNEEVEKALKQFAADELGIRVDHIRQVIVELSNGDTWGCKCQGSQGPARLGLSVQYHDRTWSDLEFEEIEPFLGGLVRVALNQCYQDALNDS